MSRDKWIAACVIGIPCLLVYAVPKYQEYKRQQTSQGHNDKLQAITKANQERDNEVIRHAQEFVKTKLSCPATSTFNDWFVLRLASKRIAQGTVNATNRYNAMLTSTWSIVFDEDDWRIHSWDHVD